MPDQPIPRVVGVDDLSDQTAQTLQLARRSALDHATVGAERMWMGLGIAKANHRSAKHHHGEAETCAYMLRGGFQLYFGDDYDQCLDVNEGEFLYVPAWIHHYEQNDNDEDTLVIVCRTPSNIVVNLE